MSYMKTATVREVQHDLKKVLSWVEDGEEVRVTRRAKVIARLLPPDAVLVEPPDFLARAKSIWTKQPKGLFLSQIVAEERGDR